MKPAENTKLELASRLVLAFHGTVSSVSGNGGNLAGLLSRWLSFWEFGLGWFEESLLMLSFLLGSRDGGNGVSYVLLKLQAVLHRE